MICLSLGCLFALSMLFCFATGKSLPLPLRILCDFLLFLAGALPFVLYVAVYKSGLYGAETTLPFLAGATVIFFIKYCLKHRN